MNSQPSRLGESVIGRRAFLGGSLAFTALGALSLAGCSPSPGSGGATGGTTAQPGTGTVSFTSWVFGQDSAGPLRDTVSAFSSDSGIKVAEDTYPYAQFLDQVVLKGRSGNVSGIAHIDEEWLSTLVTAGLVKSLDSLFDASVYPDRMKSAGVLDGSRYSLPWTQSAIGIVSNRGLLEDLGVDTGSASTPDGFADMLREIKSRDSALVPYAPCTNVAQLKDFVPWIIAFGGTVYEDGEVTLGDAGSVAAVEYWKMLLDEGLIQSGLVRDDSRQLFAQQRTPLYDDAPQAVGIIPGQSNDADIASKMHPFARPKASGGTAASNLVWSQPLVAFDDTEDSRELLTYLSTDESALRTMFEATGQPPTTTAALAADWFTSNPFNTEWNDTVASNSKVNPLWAFPAASAAQTTFNETIEPILAGTVSAKDGLAQAKAALEDLLQS